MKDIRSHNQRIVHDLKINPKYFTLLELGYKTFEIRKDDRPYRVNDILHLQSFDPVLNEYTGSTVLARILDIYGRKDDETIGIQEGYVILSIELIHSRYVQD